MQKKNISNFITLYHGITRESICFTFDEIGLVIRSPSRCLRLCIFGYTDYDLYAYVVDTICDIRIRGFAYMRGTA